MTGDNDLLEIVAVQQTIYRYSDAVTRGDWDQYASVFAPDCVWDVLNPVPMHAVGPEAITAFMREMIDQMEFFLQMSHNMVVDIVGPGRATSMTTIHEMARNADTIDGQITGVYQDELAKQDDGVWRFTSRRFSCTYFENAHLAGVTVTPRSELP